MKSNYVKYWRGSLLGMAVLSLATSSAFAATSNCKNPTEVTLAEFTLDGVTGTLTVRAGVILREPLQVEYRDGAVSPSPSR
jgi:hypothetical protein